MAAWMEYSMADMLVVVKVALKVASLVMTMVVDWDGQMAEY